jgi:hypothetical protein
MLTLLLGIKGTRSDRLTLSISGGAQRRPLHAVVRPLPGYSTLAAPEMPEAVH